MFEKYRHFRSDMKDILEVPVMVYDSDSSSTSSSCSSGEDLDTLFLDTLFCPQQEFRHKIDFKALSDCDCVECSDGLITLRNAKFCHPFREFLFVF